ncbi:DUF3102 domain-containing protein [Dehalobacter sp. DCM]|uniref:DUF3102 domain-containing protein n=1 Tax=Dehalobacter sp. DCM TaxID=2907827 RepID=UPI003081DC73|nr:DUF3102 domain-containing protein [Dehalobacter sp. DCM]
MMQIFDECEAKLQVSSEGQEISDSSPVTNLTYTNTQALIILGLPEEERDEFIAENDAGNMSKQQLQQAVSMRNQDLADNDDLQKVCAEQKDKITKLSDERDRAKKEAIENLQAVWAEQGNVL